MTKKLIGVFASVAMLSSGMALANKEHEGKEKEKQTQVEKQPQEQIGTGGSGQQDTGRQVGTGARGGMGQQPGQMEQPEQLSANQLTGRVVKSERRTIWVEHAGAVVPLKVDKNTQFLDPNLKRATDIKEGDQIRASFEVKETDNVATSIQMATGAGLGGSGQDVLTPDEGINEQPMETLPPSQEGTGGAGMEVPDIHEAPGADTGEVLDPAPENSRGDY